MTMRTRVVLNSYGDLLWLAVTDQRSIEVAGAMTIDRDPVNVRTYKTSISKRNLASARRDGLDFLTYISDTRGSYFMDKF